METGAYFMPLSRYVFGATMAKPNHEWLRDCIIVSANVNIVCEPYSPFLRKSRGLGIYFTLLRIGFLWP